jgi:hypothetical protein
MGGAEVQTHVFLTTALHEGGWLNSQPSPRERNQGTLLTADKKGQNSLPHVGCQTRFLGHPAVIFKLRRLSFPGRNKKTV